MTNFKDTKKICEDMGGEIENPKVSLIDNKYSFTCKGVDTDEFRSKLRKATIEEKI